MKLQYEHKPTMMVLLYAKAHGLPEEKRDAETRAMIETYGKQVCFLDDAALLKPVSTMELEKPL